MFDLDGTLVDSRRDLAESANIVLAEWRIGRRITMTPIGRHGRRWARPPLVTARSARRAVPQPANALRFLAIYDSRLSRSRGHALDGVPAGAWPLEHEPALAVLTNKPLGATRQILDGARPDRVLQPFAVAFSAATGRFHASPTRQAAVAHATASWRRQPRTMHGRRFDHRLADRGRRDTQASAWRAMAAGFERRRWLPAC